MCLKLLPKEDYMLKDFMCEANIEFDGHDFVFAVDHKYKLWVKIDNTYPQLFEEFKSLKKEIYVSSSMLVSIFLYGNDLKCKHEISHLINFINCCQMKLYAEIANVIDEEKISIKILLSIFSKILMFLRHLKVKDLTMMNMIIIHHIRMKLITLS